MPHFLPHLYTSVYCMFCNLYTFVLATLILASMSMDIVGMKMQGS